MRFPILLIACGVLQFTVSSVQAEQKRVYQWTDSQGVVHYTQLAPDKVHSQARDVHTANAVAVAAGAPAKPNAAAQAACDTAKSNRDKLAVGKLGQLTADKDGDGKPDPMNADDIAAAKELVDRQIAAYCKP